MATTDQPKKMISMGVQLTPQEHRLLRLKAAHANCSMAEFLRFNAGLPQRGMKSATKTK